ncbi:L-histidine N(alpha)-methyltransferase [Lipingzhangella sp. LS1_29]|uniref:L-histidine N(Alpha)-methyltransferase n=1 Tax=Lipingzhangella rawalii TaxID=2055835 RepID=A0ABU2HAM4_9ACTN|nr:L-histidine N(alpha)-methyltransferase [Lipingzhangella rawalii]MDS1271639.1 L-histidine N(alpha)-methyltransferase [Lipingzhangella rawalii]
MLRVEYRVTPDDLDKALRSDVQLGLRSEPKQLPPKWFYDDRGSALFERITELDDYYLSRVERELLRHHVTEIARAAQAVELVELGAGAAVKTRMLLDALSGSGSLRRYTPLDVSGPFLERAAAGIAEDYPDLDVRAVVADFDHTPHPTPASEARLLALLGSTLGNQTPQQRHAFLSRLRGVMGPTDQVLLGLDLVKSPERLVRAYDDPDGVTAEFNRNVLRVVNRELEANFVPEEFTHVARWNPVAEWVDIRLRAHRPQHVTIPAVDMSVDFAAGEELCTEISAKFRPEGIRTELAGSGFSVTGWWTDPDGDFALVLARPVDGGA